MAKTGRPTSFKVEYCKQAQKLALLGATDAEMADFFGVALSTLALWKVKHQEFSDSLKVGKEIADKRVVDSLYQRAMGYSHVDTDVRVIEGAIVTTELVKHYPPDTTAMIFWLKNRDPKNWRDRVEQSHVGEDGGPIDINHTVTFVKPA